MPVTDTGGTGTGGSGSGTGTGGYTLTAGFPVPFAVVFDGGIAESCTPDQGARATVVFKVDWAKRFDFVNAVCGASKRNVPMVYPPIPKLYALSVPQILPMGSFQDPTSGWVNYTKAYISVEFSTPLFSFDSTGDPSGQPWTTTTIDISGEVITLPESAFKFPGAKPVGAPCGMIIPTGAISFKRHWIASLPVAEMFNLLGKLNTAAITIGNFVCAPETVMFLGGQNEQSEATDGSLAQSVEYKLIYRQISWNKFLKPDGTGWDYLTDANGNKVYQSGDFTTLP